MKNLIGKSNFDYKILDEELAKFLQEKEKQMKNTISNAYYQIGKELKEAQEKLSGNNQYDGIFQKWYESLGFKKTTVYNYMNYYDLVVQNLEDRKQIEALPRSLVYEIAKPSADEELKEKLLDGDITTHKKYKELKKEKEKAEKEKEEMEKKLKEQKELKKKAYKKMEELEDQEPEVVVKERVPQEVQNRINELEERAGELEDHKSEVRDYKKKKKEINQEISELQEYKRKLKEENNVIAERAEIVQGIMGEIKKLRKSQGKIEKLLKKDVQLREVDLFNLNEEADYLNEMAEKIYNYIASQKSNLKGDVINV